MCLCLDLDKPVISTESLQVVNGSSASLSCDVNGTKPINVYWERNGGVVSHSSTLNFNAIQVSDVGAYKCTVNNVVGKKFANSKIDVACK